MLRELRVRNYAVIHDITLEFGPGLTVLSGETGAGKSLLVGALSLLLGGRASGEVVRSGESSTSVEGRFAVDDKPSVLTRCDEAGIDASEGWLIIRREVQREGRNRAWINGTPVTTALIKSLVSDLVDLHGQHEHQTLLSRRAQQSMLDEYAGARAEATAVAMAHATVLALEEQKQALVDTVAATRERAEFLRFKNDEITAAELHPGEEEAIGIEARRLEHSEQLQDLSGGMAESLYAGEEALLDRLGEQGRRLSDLVRIDPSAEDFVELHETAMHAVEELGRRLGSYHTNIEHDPGRLERLRRRLHAIDVLKRKYNGSVEEILAEAERIAAELDAMDTSDLELKRLTVETERARSELASAAARLREKRLEAAVRLSTEIERLLPGLGMDGGRFEVALEEIADVDAGGSELAEFRVSLNKGFEPGPLARVGSGGELSRVMLALKTVLAAVDQVPCLVFDEIDAGIGGQVGNQVAARLSEVAHRHQVFVVTHLAQIASRATNHFKIAKSDKEGRAETRAVALEGSERVEEVARMLGGDPGSDTSRRHASELIAAGGATA